LTVETDMKLGLDVTWVKKKIKIKFLPVGKKRETRQKLVRHVN
jgi:hypothetical protein